MKSYFLVFLGGGFGATLRYAIDVNFNFSRFIDHIYTVNAIGSFFLGILAALLFKNLSFQPIYLLLGTGFCGGFTTFSSFSSKNFNFLINGDFTSFAYYSLGSLFLGIILFGIGFYLTSFCLKSA